MSPVPDVRVKTWLGSPEVPLTDSVPTRTAVEEPFAPLTSLPSRAISVAVPPYWIEVAPPIDLLPTALALSMLASRILSTSSTVLEVVMFASAVSAVPSIAYAL